MHKGDKRVKTLVAISDFKGLGVKDDIKMEYKTRLRNVIYISTTECC